jgi:hypothetical protein
MRQELGALTKKRKDPWVRSFYSGDPDLMSEHVAGMITWPCQSVWLRNIYRMSCHWQTHLPDVRADNIFLLNPAHVQYQSGTGGSTVEKPAGTLRLASG